MEQIIDRVSYMLDNHGAVKVSIFKGVVNKIDISFNPETGNATAFGSLKCEKEWVDDNGKERKEIYYANFGAFGDTAMQLGIETGDEVIMLAERNRKKGKDDTWYDNNNVIMCQKL